jgi:hypothetical protein
MAIGPTDLNGLLLVEPSGRGGVSGQGAAISERRRAREYRSPEMSSLDPLRRIDPISIR